MKKYFIIPIVILSLFFTWGCNNQNKSNNKNEKDVIKIGVVLPLTGSSSEWGEMAKSGIELILEEYNLNNEKKIKVFYEDSKGEAGTAVSSIKKLIDLDNVSIVIGDMLSSTTLAMSPIANSTKTVLIGISCSSPAITNAGEYVYRVWPSDLYEGKVFANWAYNHSYQKIDIIYLKNDYGEGLKDAFKNQFKKVGGESPNEYFFTDQNKDYKNIISKTLNDNIDAIYIVGYYQNTALIMKQIRNVNKDVQILGTSSSINEKLFDLVSKEVSENFIAALVNDFDLNNLTQKQKKFVNKFEKKYKKKPDWAAVHGADAIIVAIDAVTNTQSKEEIKKYIDNKKSFKGISTDVIFDKNGDVIKKPIIIKIVKNNAFTDYK